MTLKSLNYDEFPFIKANIASQASCHHPQNLRTLIATNTKQIEITNSLPFLACLLFVDVNGVFILYCFCLIVCLGAACAVERKRALHLPKRQVTLIIPSLFSICISVFN